MGIMGRVLGLCTWPRDGYLPYFHEKCIDDLLFAVFWTGAYFRFHVHLLDIFVTCTGGFHSFYEICRSIGEPTQASSFRQRPSCQSSGPRFQTIHGRSCAQTPRLL